MTQDEARQIITNLIEAWGGIENATAVQRAAALITITETQNAGSNIRFVRRWLAGHRDLSPQTIAAIEAMANAFSGVEGK